jgi:hypothetical protein
MTTSRQRPSAPSEANEGEGSRTAARRYEQTVKQTVQSGHVDEAAREAVRALDSGEGKELREAEMRARRHKVPAIPRIPKSKKH